MPDHVVQGDTLKVKRFQILTSEYNPADLTGLTAKIRYKINKGIEKFKDLVIVNPPTLGIADLYPAIDNWDAPGWAIGHIELMNGLGGIGLTFGFMIRVDSPE